MAYSEADDKKAYLTQDSKSLTYVCRKGCKWPVDMTS